MDDSKCYEKVRTRQLPVGEEAAQDDGGPVEEQESAEVVGEVDEDFTIYDPSRVGESGAIRFDLDLSTLSKKDLRDIQMKLGFTGKDLDGRYGENTQAAYDAYIARGGDVLTGSKSLEEISYNVDEQSLINSPGMNVMDRNINIVDVNASYVPKINLNENEKALINLNAASILDSTDAVVPQEDITSEVTNDVLGIKDIEKDIVDQLTTDNLTNMLMDSAAYDNYDATSGLSQKVMLMSDDMKTRAIGDIVDFMIDNSVYDPDIINDKTNKTSTLNSMDIKAWYLSNIDILKDRINPELKSSLSMIFDVKM